MRLDRAAAERAASLSFAFRHSPFPIRIESQRIPLTLMSATDRCSSDADMEGRVEEQQATMTEETRGEEHKSGDEPASAVPAAAAQPLPEALPAADGHRKEASRDDEQRDVDAERNNAAAASQSQSAAASTAAAVPAAGRSERGERGKVYVGRCTRAVQAGDCDCRFVCCVCFPFPR